MPFSQPRSFALEEMARRQAAAQMLQQQAQTSIGGAVGALKGLNDSVDKQKAVERQQAQQALENQRAADAAAETHAQNAAGNARADAQLKLSTNADTRAAAGDQRAKEEAARTTLKFNEDADRQHITDARTTLKDFVRAGRTQGLSPGQIAAQAHDTPSLGAITGDEEVIRTWQDLEDEETGKGKDDAKEADRLRHEKVGEQQDWARIAAEKAAAAAKADKGDPHQERSIADVVDFKSAVANAAKIADGVDGGHIRGILIAQKGAKAAEEHGGTFGAFGGAIAESLAGGQMTPAEQKLFTALDAIKAKSVKGLEGAHRAVSQHQIELVDHALGAIRAGDMAGFKNQLAELARSADDTAAAIAGEKNNPGMGNPAPVATSTAGRANMAALGWK